MEKKLTYRGFDLIEFEDRTGVKCNIQKSSIATEPCIWLGVAEAKPEILASDIIEGGTGWARYPLPKEVFVNTRMHLTKDMAKDLIEVLQKFVETGDVQ